MDILIWLFIAIIFIIFELSTNTFFLIWFGVGAIAAAVLNYLGADTYIQITVFIIVSAILILSTRKFANSITPQNSKKATSERLIGKNGKILKKTDLESYIIQVAGEEWSAHSNDELNEGDTVKVVGINSIILIVEKIK